MSRYGYGDDYGSDEDGGWGGWPPYVPVAARRQRAARVSTTLERKGQKLAPVQIQGRTVAKTFWGKAWCDNLQSYSDYANRLPRGTSYLRHGAVIDLQIRPGVVEALVSGTDVYTVRIEMRSLAKPHWATLRRQCAGQIASLVDLLRGKLSPRVMELIARREDGLFPAPAAITMQCSCPDSARMCKHVAAVLYGIGTRLDQQPELLFVLRKVDHLQLISDATTAAGRTGRGARRGKDVAETARLETVFGIELAEERTAPARPRRTRVKAQAKSKGRTKTQGQMKAKDQGKGKTRARRRPRPS